MSPCDMSQDVIFHPFAVVSIYLSMYVYALCDVCQTGWSLAASLCSNLGLVICQLGIGLVA